MSDRWLRGLGVTVPVIQAPMAGSVGAAMVVAVTAAGGLGSLPCAPLGADAVRGEVGAIREATDGPFNLNFFCHERALWAGAAAALATDAPAAEVVRALSTGVPNPS